MWGGASYGQDVRGRLVNRVSNYVLRGRFL